MTTQRWTLALCCIALSVPQGLASQRPKPPPPAPVPAPAETDAQAAERARERESAKLARQAEALRQEQQKQEAERIRKARDEAEALKNQEREAERVKRAREEAAGQPTPEDPTGAVRGELRETARDMFRIEDVHRDRLARLERLLEVYRESGDQEKVAEVEKLRAKENKRYLLIMGQFKERLGGAYTQFESRLLAGQMRERGPKKPGSSVESEKPAEVRKPAEGEKFSVPRRAPKAPVKDESKGGGR